MIAIRDDFELLLQRRNVRRRRILGISDFDLIINRFAHKDFIGTDRNSDLWFLFVGENRHSKQHAEEAAEQSAQE
jgi:hypothetical protein